MVTVALRAQHQRHRLPTMCCADDPRGAATVCRSGAASHHAAACTAQRARSGPGFDVHRAEAVDGLALVDRLEDGHLALHRARPAAGWTMMPSWACWRSAAALVEDSSSDAVAAAVSRRSCRTGPVFTLCAYLGTPAAPTALAERRWPAGAPPARPYPVRQSSRMPWRPPPLGPGTRPPVPAAPRRPPLRAASRYPNSPVTPESPPSSRGAN